MKILLLLIFLPILFPSEALTNFDDEVKVGYKSYRVVEEADTNYYQLKIIQGINNDDINIGVFFYNHNPQSDMHSIEIIKNNRKYSLNTNNRNDVFAPAIVLDDNITINIYDETGKSRGTPITIESISTEEFNKLDDVILEGANQGISTTNLRRRIITFSLPILLTVIFSSVIILFGIIMLVLYFTKKGMFSESKRKENVFNFREFIDSLPKEDMYYQRGMRPNDEIRLNESDYEEIKEESRVQEPEPARPVYKRQSRYFDEEEFDQVNLDLVKYLQEKGYNTDYQNATEAEKNDVMLELMRLRDFKDITYEQYQNEVVKLWKK